MENILDPLFCDFKISLKDIRLFFCAPCSQVLSEKSRIYRKLQLTLPILFRKKTQQNMIDVVASAPQQLEEKRLLLLVSS